MKKILMVLIAVVVTMLSSFFAWAAVPAQVPQTGQATCYDAAGAVIDCTGTGQDGDLQAGGAWPIPRFTVASSGTGTVVTDKLTGLVWPQDGGTPTVGLCTGGTTSWQGALAYVACLNTNNYLGHNDWRLPNVNELKSLTYNGQSNTATWLNSQGFVNVPANSYYWSSTTSAYGANGAWGVHMNGIVSGLLNTTLVVYVWPVRMGQCGAFDTSAICLSKTGQTTVSSPGDDGSLQTGVTWPSPRFFVLSSGTGTVVTDDLTGLMWTQDGKAPGPSTCSPGELKTWHGALDYVLCLNMINYLNHNDWRLPNINELMSLVNYEEPNTATWLNAQGLMNAQASYYWSSSTSFTLGAKYSAFAVWMISGEEVYSNKANGNYVWPVRGGQTHGTIVVPPPTQTDAAIGSYVDIVFSVKNSSASTASITLAASIDKAGWSAVIVTPSSPVSIAAAAEKSVTVRVFVPAGTADSTVVNVTLSATTTMGTASDKAAVRAVAGTLPKAQITVAPSSIQTGGTVKINLTANTFVGLADLYMYLYGTNTPVKWFDGTKWNTTKTKVGTYASGSVPTLTDKSMAIPFGNGTYYIGAALISQGGAMSQKAEYEAGFSVGAEAFDMAGKQVGVFLEQVFKYDNQAPVIDSVNISPQGPYQRGQVVDLSVQGHDADSPAIQWFYVWKTTNGQLKGKKTDHFKSVKWVAPDKPGEYLIAVYMFDGDGKKAKIRIKLNVK